MTRRIALPFIQCTSTAALGLAALLANACQSEEPRNLGSTPEEQARSLTLDPNQTTFSTSVVDFDGRWVGEAEDVLALSGGAVYRFPSGSRSIVLDLKAVERNEGAWIDLGGTIVFGAGSPPPPPTDPDVGYPTDVNYPQQLSYFGDTLLATWNQGPLPPYEGYAYRIYATTSLADQDPQAIGQVADGVVSLRYSTQELLDPWCALQEPVEVADGVYNCQGTDALSIDGGCAIGRDDRDEIFGDLTTEEILALSPEEYDALDDQVTHTFEPIDCNKGILCSTRRCECDASSCWANPDNVVGNPSSVGGSLAQLTLRRQGDELVGVLENTAFLNERNRLVPLGTLRFRREE
jgi:hypothetical protein